MSGEGGISEIGEIIAIRITKGMSRDQGFVMRDINRINGAINFHGFGRLARIKEIREICNPG